MKLSAYSSLAAFVAHYRALKSARDPAAEDRLLLAEIEKLIASIGPDVRAALDSDAAGGELAGARARHRERAERRLRRELLARGVLTG